MLNELIRNIASNLDDLKIPYIIIGGQAALLYREPRFTNDIDITLGIDINEIEKILILCENLGFRILVDNPIEFAEQTMVLPAYDNSNSFRIDFIF